MSCEKHVGYKAAGKKSNKTSWWCDFSIVYTTIFVRYISILLTSVVALWFVTRNRGKVPRRMEGV